MISGLCYGLHFGIFNFICTYSFPTKKKYTRPLETTHDFPRLLNQAQSPEWCTVLLASQDAVPHGLVTYKQQTNPASNTLETLWQKRNRTTTVEHSILKWKEWQTRHIYWFKQLENPVGQNWKYTQPGEWSIFLGWPLWKLLVLLSENTFSSIFCVSWLFLLRDIPMPTIAYRHIEVSPRVRVPNPWSMAC